MPGSDTGCAPPELPPDEELDEEEELEEDELVELEPPDEVELQPPVEEPPDDELVEDELLLDDEEEHFFLQLPQLLPPQLQLPQVAAAGAATIAALATATRRILRLATIMVPNSRKDTGDCKAIAMPDTGIGHFHG